MVGESRIVPRYWGEFNVRGIIASETEMLNGLPFVSELRDQFLTEQDDTFASWQETQSSFMQWLNGLLDGLQESWFGETHTAEHRVLDRLYASTELTLLDTYGEGTADTVRRIAQAELRNFVSSNGMFGIGPMPADTAQALQASVAAHGLAAAELSNRIYTQLSQEGDVAYEDIGTLRARANNQAQQLIAVFSGLPAGISVANADGTVPPASADTIAWLQSHPPTTGFAALVLANQAEVHNQLPHTDPSSLIIDGAALQNIISPPPVEPPAPTAEPAEELISSLETPDEAARRAALDAAAGIAAGEPAEASHADELNPTQLAGTPGPAFNGTTLP